MVEGSYHHVFREQIFVVWESLAQKYVPREICTKNPRMIGLIGEIANEVRFPRIGQFWTSSNVYQKPHYDICIDVNMHIFVIFVLHMIAYCTKPFLETPDRFAMRV